MRSRCTGDRGKYTMAKLQSTQETQERKRRQNAEQPPASQTFEVIPIFPPHQEVS